MGSTSGGAGTDEDIVTNTTELDGNGTIIGDLNTTDGSGVELENTTDGFQITILVNLDFFLDEVLNSSNGSSLGDAVNDFFEEAALEQGEIAFNESFQEALDEGFSREEAAAIANDAAQEVVEANLPEEIIEIAPEPVRVEDPLETEAPLTGP